MQTDRTNATLSSRPCHRKVRRLARAALFAGVRGLAYGTGTALSATAVSAVVWWTINR